MRPRTIRTALLEILAHWNGLLPRGQKYIEITIPRGTSYEMVTEDAIPNWVRTERGGGPALRP